MARRAAVAFAVLAGAAVLGALVGAIAPVEQEGPVAAPAPSAAPGRSAAGGVLHRRPRAHSDPSSATRDERTPTPPRAGDASPPPPPPVVRDVAVVPVAPASASAPRSDAEAHAAAQVAVALNVRPGLSPGEHAGVVARNWQAAKRSLAVGGARPSLTAARAPRPAATPRSGEDYIDPSTDWEDPDTTDRASTTHGLRADYYDFLDGSLESVPALASLPPTLTRVDLAIDFRDDASFALPFPPETFAVLWRGSLDAPEAGEYEFTCGSDDGVRLAIDGKIVLEYGGLRPYAETTGRVTLAAGRHAIEVSFYENYVFASCRLFWQGPSWGKRIVESAALTPTDDVAAVVPPTLASVSPASGRVGDDVVLRGAGFAPSAQFDRVTFAGIPAEVVSAAAGELRVKVPVGASTGDVVVQVGPISSRPSRFEVENVLGLFAEYFLVGTDLSQMPDFTRIAPYFVRLDGPLSFTEDGLWALPFEPDVFAVRHSGYLYVPEEDDYRLTLGSDDGARLVLDGETVVDLPGLHSYLEDAKTLHLAAGFHPLEMQFFENRGVARLVLMWQRPSEAARSLVPLGCLWPPSGVAERPAPRIASVAPAAAATGELLTITGTDLGDDPKYVRVRFPGDVFVRPIDVSGTTLTVRVPRGTQSGFVRVAAGIVESDAAMFVLSSPIGLTADLFAFSGEFQLDAASTPDALRQLAPTSSRVDVSFALPSAASFKLGFPTSYFAVHWHGTLAVEQDEDVLWVLQSEDRAMLFVDGAAVVDAGGWHSLDERYGTTHLVGGRAFAFDLWFWNRGGDAKLHLMHTPFGLADHIDVPARWFAPK